MLPTNANSLNEHSIQMLIAEHQAEIRRCFVPRPAGERPTLGARLRRLVSPWRWATAPSAYQGTMPKAPEGAS